jgi:hypothetical protein
MPYQYHRKRFNKSKRKYFTVKLLETDLRKLDNRPFKGLTCSSIKRSLKTWVTVLLMEALEAIV